MAAGQRDGGIFHMQIAKILGKRDVRQLEQLLHRHYGCQVDLSRYRVFITRENRLWIASREVDIPFFRDMKRCYRIGIYFGKLKRNNKIKLTIEGALMVGKTATRNMAVIDEEEVMEYIQGNDVHRYRLVDAELHNFVLVKCKNDTLGCGLLREGYIESLVSKARRLVKPAASELEEHEEK